jgi:hypothetical protein
MPQFYHAHRLRRDRRLGDDTLAAADEALRPLGVTTVVAAGQFWVEGPDTSAAKWISDQIRSVLSSTMVRGRSVLDRVKDASVST